MSTPPAAWTSPPRWALMWFFAGAVFLAFKALVIRRSSLSRAQAAVFALAWVGMDPAPFRKFPASMRLLPGRAWLWPILNTLLGIALLWGAARHFTHPLAAGWVAMTGLIFILHFGSFSILALIWQSLGVPVAPIMRCPVVATSLAEFWGKRWNRAFRDLTHVFIFRPFAKRFGLAAALWLAFLISGIMHDLLISVPAGAGYGLPTLYFLLQALGISLERGLHRPSWFFTHSFTVLPAFILFHPPFVFRVMIPFFKALKALP